MKKISQDFRLTWLHFSLQDRYYIVCPSDAVSCCHLQTKWQPILDVWPQFVSNIQTAFPVVWNVFSLQLAATTSKMKENALEIVILIAWNASPLKLFTCAWGCNRICACACAGVCVPLCVYVCVCIYMYVYVCKYLPEKAFRPSIPHGVGWYGW